jgi:ABC-type ATPase involved in cell division
MAIYPITGLKADGFGPLDAVEIPLSPTLNIVTGDNATGKSQVLKLLYACTRCLNGNIALTKKDLSAGIADGLIGVFRPDSLGRLARRQRGRSRANVEVGYKDVGSLKFDFSSIATSEVQLKSIPDESVKDTPVFFPSRELLSLYPGLVSLFETREVEFDETWRDTALLLGRSALRGPRGDTAIRLLKPLMEIIEGTVAEENGRFYVRLHGQNAGKIEAHLVSEGFRKLAMIIRLVTNGVLLEGGYLFWDEPEANLNPAVQQAVAKVIVALAQSGTQVFIATHSVYLLREFELLLESQANNALAKPRYIGLYREAQDSELTAGVWAKSVTDSSELSAITALEAESAQSLRYLMS